MSTNIKSTDRWIRILLGTIFLAWAIAGGPWWSFFGLYLLASGSAKICLFYILLGLGPKPKSTSLYN